MKTQIAVNERSITKSFKFECSHRLSTVEGEKHPCRSLHGHSYTLQVTVKIHEKMKGNMIIDFGNLKMFQTWLDQNFDHAVIIYKEDLDFLKWAITSNQKFYKMDNDTTAENMADLFCDIIFYDIIRPKNYLNYSVKVAVAETVGNIATIEKMYSILT